ncbi:hypothetical protein BGZ65_007488, partial [Modicella reniformis]
MDNTRQQQQQQQQQSSGLVTPPLVSPRPVQGPMTTTTTTTATGHSGWKVVGSPPRKPLLSPPDDRTKGLLTPETIANRHASPPHHQRPQSNRDNDRQAGNSSGAPSARSMATSTAARENTDRASTKSPLNHAHDPPTSDLQQQHHHHQYRQHQGNSLQTPAAIYATTNLLADSISPNTLTATMCNNPSVARSGQDVDPFGLLDINSSGNINHQQQQLQHHPYNNMVSMTTNSGTGLESPLSMSSFIWNGRVTNEGGNNPTAAANLGGMTAMRQDTVTGGSNIFSMSAALHAHPFVPGTGGGGGGGGNVGGGGRTVRSLSLSEPLGFQSNYMSSTSTGTGIKPNSFGQGEGDPLELYRVQLPTMEEEPEDALDHPRLNRARSYSTSAAFASGSFYRSISGAATYSPTERQDPFAPSSSSSSSINSDSLGLLNNQEQHPFLHRKLSVGSTWPSVSHHNNAAGVSSSHRRSITSNTYVSPIWESPDSNPPPPQQQQQPTLERQRVSRRFSVAPSSGFQTYDHFLESEHYGSSSLSGYSNSSSNSRNPADSDYVHPQRRHSVAGPSGSYLRPNTTASFALATSMESLQLEEPEPTNNWSLNEEYEHEEHQSSQTSNTSDLGKGVNLSQLSHHGSLYVVEFKAGRNDLFYVVEGGGVALKCGDLVMVEADRGKDLGKITNDSITPQQIQVLQKEHAEAAATSVQQEGHRAPKEIHPKRIFRLAQPSEVAQLLSKNQDEIKAMAVCQTKVRQKKLPMEVVDAEYQ